jgi:hypothetical protein
MESGSRPAGRRTSSSVVPEELPSQWSDARSLREKALACERGWWAQFKPAGHRSVPAHEERQWRPIRRVRRNEPKEWELTNPMSHGGRHRCRRAAERT